MVKAIACALTVMLASSGAAQGSINQYDMVWQPLATDDPLLPHLGAQGTLYVPYAFDPAENETPGDGLRVLLTARHLALGVLLTSKGGNEHGYGMVTPTERQYRLLLELTARDVGMANGDNLAASAGLYLSQQYGSETAIVALRRAVELIPDSRFARGNLMVHLWQEAHQDKEKVTANLTEVGELFLPVPADWFRGAENEDYVIFIGIASAWYSGDIDRTNLLLDQHVNSAQPSPWLQQQLDALFQTEDE